MTTTDSGQIANGVDGAGRKPARTVAMTEFPRPVVVISRCIDFDSCRYNGQVVRASLRDELESHVDFVPICPELEIGWACPRPDQNGRSCRLRSGWCSRRPGSI